MSLRILTFVAPVLFLLFWLFLAANEFELPTLLFGETKKTFAVVHTTKARHIGSGAFDSVVTYKYQVADSIYTNNYQVGVIKRSKQVGKVLSIEYEVEHPENNKVVGYFNTTPKSVPPELFLPTEEIIEVYQPTLIVHQANKFDLERIRLEMGDQAFYTSADDNDWYYSQLVDLLDSIRIPIIISECKNLTLLTKNKEESYLRGKHSGMFDYIYFDGTNFKQTDVISLLEERQKQSEP